MSSDTPAVPRNRSVELQEVESSSSNENLSSMQNAHASTDALQALVTTCGEGEAVGDQKDFVARWWVDVLFVCCGVSVFARTEAFFMQTDLFVRRQPGCALLRTLCVVFVVVCITFLFYKMPSQTHMNRRPILRRLLPPPLPLPLPLPLPRPRTSVMYTVGNAPETERRSALILG